MKKIVFRANAGPSIGSGHIMRCLSLAAAFQERGYECVFLCSGSELESKIKAARCNFFKVPGAEEVLDPELPTLVPLLQELRPDLLIVDSYQVTSAYLSALRQLCPVAYLDDLAAFAYPCDFLINYNLYALDWTKRYTDLYAGHTPQLILGPSYAPLRKEFQGLSPRTIRPTIQDVLVSTGGADPEGIAVRLLETLPAYKQWQHTCFHFMVGALHPDLPRLQALAAAQSNVQLHINVQKVSDLMLSCDAAIAAAGSTLYELCACGTPTVTYTLADNQLPGAAAFAAHGLMGNAGDCRQNTEFIPRLLEKLAALSLASKRVDMSATMRKIVDGKGAIRLTTTLLATINSPA